MAALILSSSSPRGSLGLGNPARPNIMSTGTGPLAFAGVTTVMWILTLIAGYAELSTSPIRSLAMTGVKPMNLVIDGGHGPGDLGDVVRHEAIDIFREHVDDLGAALFPPHLRRRHLLAVVHRERVGNIGIGIGLRFVVVGVVRSIFVAAPTRAKRLDAELIHHVLVILVGGEGDRGATGVCARSVAAATNMKHRNRKRRFEAKRTGIAPE